MTLPWSILGGGLPVVLFAMPMLVAALNPSPWPWGRLTLFDPAVMLFFLLRVTGVPLTEKRALASRGDDDRAYQRTTNAFFPGPPQEDPQS